MIAIKLANKVVKKICNLCIVQQQTEREKYEQKNSLVFLAFDSPSRAGGEGAKEEEKEKRTSDEWLY